MPTLRKREYNGRRNGDDKGNIRGTLAVEENADDLYKGGKNE